MRATILIVEDDATLRTFYRTALTLAGYVVVAAEDGIDALRLIEASRPSAIVLDLALPRLSGYDVASELAAHTSTHNIPIIVVTGGNTRGLDRSQFACILRKPLDAEALVEAVERCLGR